MKIAVLTGAGISAESGIRTFRDSDGLWEGHDVMEVASPEGFERNPQLVLNFYNHRRRQLHEVSPNEAHHLLAGLENDHDVVIITQNVDDLHERAGSSEVLHLHGELLKARPMSEGMGDIISWTGDLNVGSVDQEGRQLRPHIVWFGEPVPMMDRAVREVESADIFLVVGTSLQVYPAASLLRYVPTGTPLVLIDPKPIAYDTPFVHIEQPATIGVRQWIEDWL